MTQRQKQILRLIIQEYRREALPVSSFLISRKYKTKISSATIRNEMVLLEKEGYLQALHPSSGRIPTDQGFRFFVDTLMQEKELSLKEQKRLKDELSKEKVKNKKLSRILSSLLARVSGNLIIAGLGDDIDEAGFALLLKEPEFERREVILQIAQFLDDINDTFYDFFQQAEEERIEIYIGNEVPVIRNPEISILTTKIKPASEEDGLILLLGPKRMSYEHNISLLGYIRSLL